VRKKALEAADTTTCSWTFEEAFGIFFAYVTGHPKYHAVINTSFQQLEYFALF
jgi:hypothetical protein